MKILAVVLAVALGSADGGMDTPYNDTDAGVHQVASAMLYDGGALGPGWYLAPGRMQKVGERLAVLENDANVARRERDEALANAGPGWGFWAGVATGSVMVAASVTAVVLLVK